MRRKMTLEELDSIEVEEESNTLFWKGKPIKTESRISFGWLGKLVGFTFSFFGILSPILYTLAEYDKIKATTCNVNSFQWLKFIFSC